MGVFWLSPPPAGGGGGGGGGGAGLGAVGIPNVGVSMLGRTAWKRPALTDMTIIRQGGAPWTITDYNTDGAATGPLAIQAGGNDAALRGAVIAHGLTQLPSHITAFLSADMGNYGGSFGANAQCGIAYYESSSQKAVVFGPESGTGNLSYITYDASGSKIAVITSAADLRATSGAAIWLRLSVTALSFFGEVSTDGLVWATCTPGGIGDSGFFTGVPDCFGLLHYAGNVNNGTGVSAWHLFATA